VKTVYAPLFGVPSEAAGSPKILDYEIMRRRSAVRLYLKVKVNLPSALELADASAYPEGVKLGIRKQIANDQEVTLEQIRILLGWAARRAQHTGR
jgi:hypothetical protein